MVIPWGLVLTAAAGILLGAVWASRRAGARGAGETTASDLAIVMAVAGVVAGRLVSVLIDVAFAGWSALDPRAVMTLGAGVSTSGALLGMLAVGAWVRRRGRAPDAAWRALVPPAALGLAVWSVLSLARGESAGITAAFPLGWPLPGEPANRVPVGVLEGLAFGLFAFLAWRAERVGPAASLARMGGARLAALLAALAAALHLAGGLLRPAAATVDGDLDVLLGVLALILSVAVVFDALGRMAVAGAVSGLVVVTLLVLVSSLPTDDRAVASEALTSATPSLERAIGPGGEGEGEVVRWDEADLAALVRAAGGRPVVVNVWASWCPPCRAEAPVLARALRAHGNEVIFLGLNVDRDTEAARAFARRYGLPFPSVADGGLREALGVPGLPTTVVLDADGRIVARIVGGVDARSLAAAIDRAR